jgi:hypothetical protein
MPKPIAGWYGQLFFRGSQSTGWSEGYYLKASIGDSTTAKSQIDAVATARLGLLNDTFEQVGVRLSRLDTLRDVYSILPFAFTQGTLTSTEGEGDFGHPGQCVLMRSLAEDGYASNRFLHGVPAEVIDSGFYDPLGGGAFKTAWRAAMAAYFSALTANTQGVYFQRPAPPVPIPNPRPILIKAWLAHAEQRLAIRQIGRPFGLSRGRSV